MTMMLHRARRALITLAALLVLAVPVRADEPLPETQAAAFQAVISSQVEAFRADDWARAFSYAAPSIQAQFGNPEIFRTMVMRGYRAVAQPSLFEYEEARVVDGRPAQIVYVIGPDGVAQRAVYFMQQQDDGTWRISGVVLLPIEGKST